MKINLYSLLYSFIGMIIILLIKIVSPLNSIILFTFYWIMSLVFLYRKHNDIASLHIFFVLLFGMYAILGPVEHLYGSLNYFMSSFKLDTINQYIYYNSLFLSVFTFAGLNLKPIFPIKEHFSLKASNEIGFGLTLFALLIEAINIFRIGGFNTIALGKVAIMDSYSEMLYLPTISLLIIIVSILNFSDGRVNLLRVFSYTIISMFCFYYIITGFRGYIITILISFYITKNFYTPKKLNFKLVILVFIIAIGFIIIGEYRNQITKFFIYGTHFELDKFMSLSFKEFLINLSKYEYGYAYINFGTFMNNTNVNSDYLYGKSIIDAFISAIPRFLLFFDKPESILYIFKENYFSGSITKGIYSSYGFSMILEGVMNFGGIGVVLYSVLISFLYTIVHKFKYSTTWKYFPLVYVYLFSMTVKIPRYEFMYIFRSMVIFAEILIALYLMENIFLKKIKKD